MWVGDRDLLGFPLALSSDLACLPTPRGTRMVGWSGAMQHTSARSAARSASFGLRGQAGMFIHPSVKHIMVFGEAIHPCSVCTQTRMCVSFGARLATLATVSHSVGSISAKYCLFQIICTAPVSGRYLTNTVSNVKGQDGSSTVPGQSRLCTNSVRIGSDQITSRGPDYMARPSVISEVGVFCEHIASTVGE